MHYVLEMREQKLYVYLIEFGKILCFEMYKFKRSLRFNSPILYWDFTIYFTTGTLFIVYYYYFKMLKGSNEYSVLMAMQSSRKSCIGTECPSPPAPRPKHHHHLPPAQMHSHQLAERMCHTQTALWSPSNRCGDTGPIPLPPCRARCRRQSRPSQSRRRSVRAARTSPPTGWRTAAHRPDNRPSSTCAIAQRSGGRAMAAGSLSKSYGPWCRHCAWLGRWFRW